MAEPLGSAEPRLKDSSLDDGHSCFHVLRLNSVVELFVLVLEVLLEDDDVGLQVRLRDLVDLAQVRVHVVAAVATVAAQRTTVRFGAGVNPTERYKDIFVHYIDSLTI